MSIKIALTRCEEDSGNWSQTLVCVGGELDDAAEAIKFLVFKDTTNGKKYKFQVTNGAIELVEVS